MWAQNQFKAKDQIFIAYPFYTLNDHQIHPLDFKILRIFYLPQWWSDLQKLPKLEIPTKEVKSELDSSSLLITCQSHQDIFLFLHFSISHVVSLLSPFSPTTSILLHFLYTCTYLHKAYTRYLFNFFWKPILFLHFQPAVHASYSSPSSSFAFKIQEKNC